MSSLINKLQAIISKLIRISVIHLMCPQHHYRRNLVIMWWQRQMPLLFIWTIRHARSSLNSLRIISVCSFVGVCVFVSWAGLSSQWCGMQQGGDGEAKFGTETRVYCGGVTIQRKFHRFSFLFGGHHFVQDIPISFMDPKQIKSIINIRTQN